MQEDQRLSNLLTTIADTISQMSDDEVRAELAEEGPRPGPSVSEIISAQLEKHRAKPAPSSITIPYARGVPLPDIARQHGLTVPQIRLILAQHHQYCFGRPREIALPEKQ